MFAAKKQIKVGFVAPCASNWSCDYIYEFMDKSEEFFPYIIIPRILFDTQDEKSTYEEIFQTAVAFFRKKGFRI